MLDEPPQRATSHYGASTSSKDSPSSGDNAFVHTYPACAGDVPPGRYAHAAAIVGDHLYVYGGASATVLDDLHALDTEAMVWRRLTPRLAHGRKEDRPAAVYAAAMAATDPATLWLFGGHTGRKPLRTLHALDLRAPAWRECAPGGRSPAARAGHALVAVGAPGPDQRLALFGGEGPRLLNDLHFLSDLGGRGEWTEATAAAASARSPAAAGAAAAAPAPRRGHTLVWDGGDRLVCFGGTSAAGADARVHVYSLALRRWSAPDCCGTIPSPRTEHSATLLRPGQMLVFGGCNDQGVSFNCSYCLDLTTWTWTRPTPLNPPPPPRHQHSCLALSPGRALLFGGTDPRHRRAFDGAVLLETPSAASAGWGADLGALGEELARMGGDAAAGGAAAGGGGGAVGGALMAAQLRDLLVRRRLEELQLGAARSAGEARAALAAERVERGGLAADAAALRAVAEEAEAARGAAAAAAAESDARARRGAAEAKAARAAAEAAARRAEAAEAALGEARALLRALTHEVGLLASRHRRAVGERDAARAARAATAAQLAQARAALAGGAAASSTATDPGAAAARPAAPEAAPASPAPEAPPDALSPFPDGDHPEAARTSPPPALEGWLPLHWQPQPLLPPHPSPDPAHGALDPSRDARVAACPHGGVPASCVVCACERFLTGDGAPAPFTAAPAPPGAAAAAAAAAAEVAPLALAGLAELRARERALEAGLARVRSEIVERSVAEAGRRAAGAEQRCSLCWDRPRRLAFNCGHQTCAECGERLAACPFCRTAITARIRLFAC